MQLLFCDAMLKCCAFENYTGILIWYASLISIHYHHCFPINSPFLLLT
jgi:hypothetical protein